MATSFTVNSVLLGTLSQIVDVNGAPDTFQSPPVWSTSDSTVLSLTASADGLSATGTALKVGSVVVTVVGDGVSESITLTITVDAVGSFVISFAVAPVAPVAPATAA